MNELFNILCFVTIFGSALMTAYFLGVQRGLKEMRDAQMKIIADHSRERLEDLTKSIRAFLDKTREEKE